MPNLTPRDVYNPNPSTSPDVASPSNYLTVKANPNETGAQIGQAAEKAGGAIGQAGQQGADLALYMQGFVNEHQANMAEQESVVQARQQFADYKAQNSGFAALNNKGAVLAGIQKTYQDAAAKLNPVARKAFEQQTIRSFGYVIGDINDYAADQVSSAMQLGKRSALELTQAQAGAYDNAIDDNRFSNFTGDARHQYNDLMTNPAAKGQLAGIPAKQNPDGTLTFDTTTAQGQTAQAVYDQGWQTEYGKMWENRALSLAQGDANHPPNVSAAMALVKDPKNNIPVAAKTSIINKLNGPWRTQLSWQAGEDGVANARAGYIDSLKGGESLPSSPNNLGNVRLKSGEFANPETPVDGVILTANTIREDRYQNKTLGQIGKIWSHGNPDWAANVSKATGISVNSIPNLNDPQVVKNLVSGIASAEKSKTDRATFNDDSISKGVEAAFSGAKAKLNPVAAGSSNSPGGIPEVDFLRQTAPQYADMVRQSVIDQGGDAALAEEAVNHFHSRVAQEATAQEARGRMLQDKFAAMIFNEQNPITSIASLAFSGDPQVRKDWAEFQGLNPWAAESLTKTIQAQAQGLSKSYGTDFYRYEQQVLSGQVTDIGQLRDYIGGDNTPISTSGSYALMNEIKAMQTPQGQAFGHAQMEFLHQAHQAITGAGLPGIDGAKREPLFNKFLQMALPQIQADRNNMSPGELFGDKQKSPLWKAVEAASPTLTQIKTEAGSEAIYHMQVPKTAPTSTSHTTATDVNAGKLDLDKIKTKEDIIKNYGKLTPEQRHTLYGKLGLATPDAPSVPLPQ